MTDLTVKLGTQWMNRNNSLCMVIDCYTTTNCNGQTVKTEWLSKHDFVGQRVEHMDNETTIRMGIDRLAKSKK